MECSKADTSAVYASMMLLAAEKAAASKILSSGPARPCYEVRCFLGKEIRNEDELEIYHQTVTASAKKPIPRRARARRSHVAVAAGEPSNHREIRGNHFTQGARYDSFFFRGIGRGTLKLSMKPW